MKTTTLIFHTFVASILHKLSVYLDTTIKLLQSYTLGLFAVNPSVYDLKKSEEVAQQNSMTAKLFVDNSTSARETYMFLPTWVRAFTS